MSKLHVVLRKEEIDEGKIASCTAVVFDVIFATSSIAAALSNGAKEVIPVQNPEEALRLASQMKTGTYLLAGEKDGYLMEGFHLPSPLDLTSEWVEGKTVIYSTTNGTVAVRKSEKAKTVYTASLLNGAAVAERIVQKREDRTLVLVCSGSRGRFSLEDFYGAGYMIDQLLKREPSEWVLTDAARAAYEYFANYPGSSEECLRSSRIGGRLAAHGYSESVRYAAQKGLLQVVPRLVNGRLVADC
jgi:2-phosphosulfolactate phosphatase